MLHQAAAAGDEAAHCQIIAAVKDQRGVIGHCPASQGTAGSTNTNRQGTSTDGGDAAVGVVGGQGQGAGAKLGQSTRARDRIG